MEEEGESYISRGGVNSTEICKTLQSGVRPINVKFKKKVQGFYTIESFSSSLERYDVTLKMLTKVPNMVVAVPPPEVLVVC